MIRNLTLALVLLCTATLLRGQFEQRLTLNFSAGLVAPSGPKEYVDYDVPLTDTYFSGTIAQTRPYLMANFNKGMSFYGGIQYNFSRQFATAFSVQLFQILNWEYSYEWNFMYPEETIRGSWMEWQIRESDIDPDGSYDVIVESGENKLSLTNIGISATPKVYALPGRRFNPYLFGEISYNLTNLSLRNNYGRAINRYHIEGIEYEPLVKILERSIGLGLYPGMGAEFRLSENLGIFLQGGYSVIFVNDKKLKDAGFAAENFTNMRTEAGVKLSFWRSKNL